MMPSMSCALTSTFLFGIDDDDESEEVDVNVNVVSIHNGATSEHDKEPYGMPFL